MTAVVLSMLSLVPGGMGGSETYARELLHELGARGADVTALVPPVAEGFTPAGVREVVVPEYRTGPAARDRLTALATSRLRRAALRRYSAGADVVHFPFTLPVPPASPGQHSVVTLLDVQHHDLPHLFSRAERVYRRFAYDRAALRADAVIAISDFAKRQMVRHLGLDPARVHVAPLGVRTTDYTVGPPEREPFVLYPARGWAHKNHVTLFGAVERLRRSRPGMRLVLTGAPPSELPPVPDGVEVRGHVSRQELIGLYQRASALVFPSRYEGFGLPVLEAMSAGCPVAAANSGALADVVGDAGVLFDPLDPTDLVRGVCEALDRATELRDRGLARAREFTWSACADAHERVYAGAGP